MVELKWVADYPIVYEEVDLHFIDGLVTRVYGDGGCNELANDVAGSTDAASRFGVLPR
ncbi:MAG: hypothetical protein OR997_06865 [Methylophilaceae bacterium]|nr:hypothetical protein [Methylophilaceae bacterium]